jgi:hypothetical protein
MKHLILLTALITPIAAHAQPSQFCVPPSLAQTLAATLQQDAAVLGMLNDAAQEPQRQAAAVAAAVAKQKAEDETAAKTGAAGEIPAGTPHMPNFVSPGAGTMPTRP